MGLFLYGSRLVNWNQHVLIMIWYPLFNSLHKLLEEFIIAKRILHVFLPWQFDYSDRAYSTSLTSPPSHLDTKLTASFSFCTILDSHILLASIIKSADSCFNIGSNKYLILLWSVLIMNCFTRRYCLYFFTTKEIAEI